MSVSKLWHAALLLASWSCLAPRVTALVFAKVNPSDSEAYQKFVEAKLAKKYMLDWKPKQWQSKSRCNTKNLPHATLEVVNRTCGEHPASWDRCVCIVAKAHSCHVGCSLRKPKSADPCPAECSARTCKSGAYSGSMGGLALNGGNVGGKCWNYCSKEYNHGWYTARYCGRGYWFETGDSIDCTGCNPQAPPKETKIQTKKEVWTKCMANCYPNPTCQDMCASGTADCYPKCIGQYTSAVEPFWDVFEEKWVDEDVSDYRPKVPK